MDVTAVYEIRRVETGDVYVGISRNPVQRWRTHRSDAFTGRRHTHLACALRKYGADAFSFTVVAALPSRELALLAERALVARLKPAYNMTHGGDAAPAKSAATRARIAEKARNRSHPQLQTPEARAKRIATLKATLAAKPRPKLTAEQNRLRRNAQSRAYYHARKLAASG